MKNFYFTLFALLFSATAFGQKTEFSIGLNSGLFSFAGSRASGTANIYSYPQTDYYTDLGFGAKKALSYGVSLNLKRVTKRKMLLGVNFGFEVLRSKASVDKVYESNDTVGLDATGKIFDNNSFLNLNPYIGYRFAFRHFSLDLTGGFELAYNFKETTRGKATATNGKKYTVFDRTTPSVGFDLRPGVQLSANYKKLELYVGYSYGLVDYMMWTKTEVYPGVNYVTPDAYARLLRFGVTYKIK